MHVPSNLPLLATVLAVVFGSIGAVHLFGPRFLREAFEKWNYGTRVRLFVGVLEIAVAFMLVHPELRAWGVALAALIMFGAVITLLSHEQYRCAVASMVLMAALVPAGLAVPQMGHQVHYAPIQTVSHQTSVPQQVAENGRAL